MSEKDTTNRIIGGKGGDGFPPGAGGNVNLEICAGEGGEYPPGTAVALGAMPCVHGRVRFMIAGVEWMRIEPNGGFFVKGEKVVTNQEVYDRFVAWLTQAELAALPGKPASVVE